ncbi:MAG: ATP-binding protein [Erythrobacter sp.]
MATQEPILAARGLTDEQGRLLSADPPLVELQQRCGGQVPGMLAVPELLEIVQQSRATQLRLAREFRAFDGVGEITGFVRVSPVDSADHSGCELLIENWQREDSGPEGQRESSDRQDAVDRSTSELFARLDANQRVLTIETRSADLADLRQAVKTRPGRVWSDYLELIGIAHQQPLHWRLLDGVQCTVAGSDRKWTARLLPLGTSANSPSGFELLLVANQPLPRARSNDPNRQSPASLIGEALTSSLRSPITRVIGNAETIRTRMAGPLRQEYSDYAGDIATAGQHLLGLLDDLTDLEVVESDDFTAAEDEIDLAEAARNAASILGAKATDNGISISLPSEHERAPAIGEMRRVLQILLNLLGNAINYAPRNSAIAVTVSMDRKGRSTISVSDEGPGLSHDQQSRVFRKFERLGREGDGGSGLGLYISQRLAVAMQGELRIESEEGKGARFTLALPPGN